MVLGLILTGIGFLAMIGAVYDQAAHGKASMWWLVLAYLFHTMGELCISPVGLSMVTKLAPLRLASLMMGVWFLINFVANWLAGYVGSFAESLGELTIFGGLRGRWSDSRSYSGCSPDADSLDARGRSNPHGLSRPQPRGAPEHQVSLINDGAS
jgi:hypothetical protein